MTTDMITTTPINKNWGVVRWISPDKSRIKIRLPRGGTIKAQNEGFDIGDSVCFAVDYLGRVVKVMSRLTADMIMHMASNPVLQSAYQTEEVNNEDFNPTIDEPDYRPPVEECPHLYGIEYREDAVRGRNYDDDPLDAYPPPRIEG